MTPNSPWGGGAKDTSMKDYRIQNLDLAACIMTVTGFEPEITFPDGSLATFTFPDCQEVRDVVIGYESGLALNARKLLANRLKLFRRIRQGGGR